MLVSAIVTKVVIIVIIPCNIIIIVIAIVMNIICHQPLTTIAM